MYFEKDIQFSGLAYTHIIETKRGEVYKFKDVLDDENQRCILPLYDPIPSVPWVLPSYLHKALVWEHVGMKRVVRRAFLRDELCAYLAVSLYRGFAYFCVPDESVQ